jgi:hypothetical protein
MYQPWLKPWSVPYFPSISPYFHMSPISTPYFHKPAIIDFLKQTQTNKWSSVIPFQPVGSKLPFFCFHEVGGNVLHYSVLIKYLCSDPPFYGIQAQGLDGITPPFTNLEDMVRQLEHTTGRTGNLRFPIDFTYHRCPLFWTTIATCKKRS